MQLARAVIDAEVLRGGSRVATAYEAIFEVYWVSRRASRFLDSSKEFVHLSVCLPAAGAHGCGATACAELLVGNKVELEHLSY